MLARSESRDGFKVRVLAVHTTEGGDDLSARELRDAEWWTGSSHAAADQRELLEDGFIPYDRAAWTLRSGNRWSENIELCAQAGWTREDWLARPKLLDNCARWLAKRSNARGIPLVKITASQYRAGMSGVIGHHDHTVGYRDGSHWDPGPDFPWDIVLPLARDYARGATPMEDDMTPGESAMLRHIYETMTPGIPGKKNHGRGYAWIVNALNQLAAKAKVDPAKLAVDIADELADDGLAVQPVKE